MATYLADRVVVYEGQPSVKALAKRPEALREYHPRINLLITLFFERIVDSISSELPKLTPCPSPLLLSPYSPLSVSGMNSFLATLEVSMRRDPTNYRPRVNKLNSIKDKEQKASGNYFFLDQE